MIRFMLGVCVVIGAALVAPAAAAPAFNSADLIVSASPFVFLALVCPRRPRRPRVPWFATIPDTHPDALGSLDREPITPNP